jgi:hypothetical protein
MKSIPGLAAFVCVSVVLLALGGCSGKKDSEPKKDSKSSGSSNDPTDLEFLGSAVLMSATRSEKGAVNADDLKPHLEGTKDFDERVILDKVRSGEIVIVWGTRVELLDKAPGGKSDYVILYEKEAPTSGGYVVTGDIKAKKVTPDEFKKLKMAPTNKK